MVVVEVKDVCFFSGYEEKVVVSCCSFHTYKEIEGDDDDDDDDASSVAPAA